MSALRHQYKMDSTTAHLSVTSFSSFLYLSTALLVYCIIYCKAPLLRTYVCIIMVVSSDVFGKGTFACPCVGDHAYRYCMSSIYQLPGAQCGGFPPMG